METLNREDILRMIGLRDSAGLYSKINSLMIDMYDEGGKLAEYSTQIIQTEKNITLLAQRVTDNETDIADLTVTAQQITASVSSLTTTVNDHTSKIGELVIKDNEISQRVSVVEGDYVKKAQISLMVTKNDDGYISNALVNADDITFVFTDAVTWYWQSKDDANKRMGLDDDGNLWISGQYRGGTITQNVTIGTGTKKMVIEPISTGARLVGRDGDTEVISVGFMNYGNVAPYININNGASGSSFAYTQLDYNSIQFGAGNNYMFAIKYNSSGRIAIHGNWSSWYKDSELSSLSKGDVYVDGDGFLKVKNY